MTDADIFVAAGLYGPDAADAGVRLALLTFLVDEVGASIPEIVQAEEEDRLVSMAAYRSIRPGRLHLTLADAADRAGLAPEYARRVWRAAGFPDPRPFERRFGDADVELLDLMRLSCEFFGEDATLQLVRTLGSASAQIAEAEIALVRSNMEARLLDQEQVVQIARTYRDIVVALFPRVVDTIDTLHRHHVEAIARRYSGSRPTVTNVVQLAVGFADLSGFTGISSSLDAEELEAMIARFESTTGDVVASAGANIVKRIGDAVMFVTNAPGVACGLALELVEACAEAGLPKLRGGVAFGDVIVRQGDCYGPTVNLAARLVGAADPGTVLTDASLRDRLARARGPYTFLPTGRLTLGGFDVPVDAYQLLRP